MNADAQRVEGDSRPATSSARVQGKVERDRNRRELLELLFAHLVDAIFLLEPDGRIVDVNPAACTMLGFAREELLLMHPWDFVTSVSREEILELIRGIKPEMSVNVQRTYRQKMGEQRVMDLRLTRFRCPGGDLLVASCRDITEQRHLEDQLRDLAVRQRQEEELHRLNAELEHRRHT